MRYRLDHRLTQKQVADRLGVSDVEISRLENADRLASMATSSPRASPTRSANARTMT